MEEILDRFLIRIIFALFCCIILYAYKYSHFLFYRRSIKQVKNEFNLLENPSDTLHFLSRILGLAIIFSFVEFNRFLSVEVSLIHLSIVSLTIMISYLISLLIIEAIVLHKFNYRTEILKNNNFSYALIIFSLNISTAFIIKSILLHSQNSVLIFLTLWLFAMCLLGLIARLFNFYSRFQFNRNISQQSIGVAISFAFYILGTTYLLSKSFDQPHIEKYSYMLRIFFKVFLSVLIVPVFIAAIRFIFSLKMKKNLVQSYIEDKEKSISYGLAEGLVFLISAIMTSWIVFNINLTGVFTFV